MVSVEVEKLSKRKFTAMIHAKGYQVNEFLKFINHSLDWYSRNSNGSKHQKLRLFMMINSLVEKE